MRDNLNSTLPAAPVGYANASIQADVPWANDPNANRNISFYMPNVGGVSIKTGSYTLVAADCGKLISANSASSLTFTLPASSPFALWKVLIQNVGAGVLTVSRNGLNIDGAAADLTLNQNQGVIIATDDTNYFTERGMGTGGGGGGGVGGVSVKTTSYTLVSGDLGKLVVYNSGSAGTFTLPASPPSSTWEVFIENTGSGTLTVSPNGLQLDGVGGSLPVSTNQGVYISTDGTNYFTERGMGSGGSAPSGIYAVNMSITGQPSGGSVVLSMFVFTEAVNFAVNWGGSYGKVLTNPTSTQTWTINKNGSSVGSIGISTSGVVTFTSSGTISFAAGDLLTVVGSASIDATLSGVVINFQGIRASLTSTPIAVIPFSWLGQIPASQVIGQYVFTTAITFLGNWSGARGKVISNPAATWTADIRKNGSSVGSVVVSTSGTFTFSSTSGNPVSFVGGDELTVVGPGSLDTSLQSIAYSFTGSAGGYVQLGGDLGGTSTSPKVIGIQGVGVSATSPTNGQVLEYDSGSGLYVPASLAATGPIPAAPYIIIVGTKYLAANMYPVTVPNFTGYTYLQGTTTNTSGANGSVTLLNTSNTDAWYGKSASASIECLFNESAYGNGTSFLCCSIWMWDVTNSKLYSLGAYASSRAAGDELAAPTILFRSYPYSGTTVGSATNLFYGGSLIAPVMHLKLSVSGTTLSVQYSCDGGQTYQQPTTATIGTISKAGVAVSNNGGSGVMNVLSLAVS